MNAGSKRLLMWAVVAGLVLAGLLAAFWPRAVAVDLVTAERSSMIVTVEEEGKTRIHDVFAVSAPVAGRVQRITLHVGDSVSAGDTVLARIEPGDPALLDPRSEAEARAAVRTAESAHDLATAEVERFSAELAFAKSELKRAQELAADGTLSERDLEQAERSHRTRRAELATARAALQMRQFELDQARAKVDVTPLTTQGNHDDCECIPITAPVTGRVLQILEASARTVQAGEPLVEIGDPGQLEVVADFLSVDAVKIEPGQRVLIDRWGGGAPLQGQVRRVEPFGVTKISALGIEEQRVNVVIDFLDPPEERAELGHGYQVDARVVLWEGEDVLTVPLTALFRRNEAWAVFAQEAGRAVVKPIEVGQRNGLVAEVLDGLEEGDLIVLHPSDRVAAGVRIRARG